jgi:fatty acid desaturase
MSMTPRPQRDYVREVRERLPADIYGPRPQKLWAILAHSLVLAAGILVIRNAPPMWLLPVVALIMGHSMGCLGFIVHDLSHNSVVTRQPLKYLLELYVWGLVVTSAHMWHRIHNQSHHRMPNALSDPDRRYLTSEKTLAVRWYDRLFVPSRASGRLHLTFLAFFAYITRNMTTALLFPGTRRPSVATYKPAYTAHDRLRMHFEFGVGIAIHVGVFFAAGATLSHYLWAGLLPAIGGSIVLSAYTVTNHLLNPLMPEPVDPLRTTTSLRVPRFVDWLHHHFSHHTEHHLFPHMSSDYYPLVRRVLKEHYPDRFQCVTYGEALRLLWQSEPFMEPPASGASVDHARPIAPRLKTDAAQ